MGKYRGIYKRGNIYYIRYVDPSGKVIRESARTTNLKEALKFLAQRKAEVLKGEIHERVKIKNYSFKELAERYKEWAEIQKSWNKSKRYMVEVLEQRFGNIALRKLEPSIIGKFVVDIVKQDKKPATVNKYLVILKHMLRKAVEWNMVEDFILKRLSSIKQLRLNNRRLRYLTKEEIERFLSCCDEKLYPIVFTALNTGMRKSEILGLKWSNVDLKNGYIYIERSKNEESRVIPMNKRLLELFKRMYEKRQGDYVFINPKTGDRYKDIKSAFKTALKKAGIKNFHFHDLRHTFASHLVMAGVDLTTVKELLGHKDIKMTLRYSHLAPEHKQKAVNVLNNLFSK